MLDPTNNTNLPHTQPPKPPHSSNDPQLKQVSLSLVERLRALRPINLTDSQLEVLLYRATEASHYRLGELRVGIYDGSFDPPHFGHVETARAAMDLGRLDLLVINCHLQPSIAKPNLSPHELRSKMLASYFREETNTIVSPLSRGEIESLLAPYRTVGVIGSDAFNRFLRQGIAKDFNTHEIFVAERSEEPLTSAPVFLEERPVVYAGAAQLAFNNGSSTRVRAVLSSGGLDEISPPINTTTADIIAKNHLYAVKRTTPGVITTSPLNTAPLSFEDIPKEYRGCTVVPRLGLHNGLLSISNLFEVRTSSGEVVAFVKTLPPERDPQTNLLDEAHGLSLINELSLETATAPHAKLSEAPLALWVSRAPGETISSLLTRYDRGLVSEDEVYKALHAVGAFLRELHNRCEQPFTREAERLLEAYIEHHESRIARARPQDIAERGMAEALKDFQTSAQHLKEVGLRCSLIHGDANCGNLLWDTKTQRLSIIDLQRFGTQARTGEPEFCAHDYQNFLCSLQMYPNIGFRGMRGGLLGAISAFRDGYGPINPHEERFFLSLWRIRASLGRHHRFVPVKANAAGTVLFP